MNYNEGIGLLTGFSGKGGYNRMFAGKERSMKDKLAYEICKSARVANHTNWRKFIRNAGMEHGGDYTDFIGEQQKRNAKTENELPPELPEESTDLEGDDEHQQSGTAKTFEEYPPIIKRIMQDMAALYTERSICHTRMVNMSESNQRAVVKERVKLFDQVKALSERFNWLYYTKQTFLEKGIVPDERVVYPEKSAEKVAEKIEKPDAEKLRKQKKNLQSSNSKDKKRVDYENDKNKDQQNSLMAKKKLMLELKMMERNNQIEEINYQLIMMK